jgi:hypothetical protein
MKRNGGSLEWTIIIILAVVVIVVTIFESRWVHMKRDPELWMVVVSLAIAAAFVTLMGFACAADVAYYQEHGVWWGTPPPK